MPIPKDQMKGPSGYIPPKGGKNFPMKAKKSAAAPEPQAILAAPSNKRMNIIRSK